MPVDFPAILAFMNEELRDFDSPEATEIRERAELAELKRLLSGSRPERDVDRIRRRKATGLLLTPAEEHLLRLQLYMRGVEGENQAACGPLQEGSCSVDRLRRSIRYFFATV